MLSDILCYGNIRPLKLYENRLTIGRVFEETRGYWSPISECWAAAGRYNCELSSCSDTIDSSRKRNLAHQLIRYTTHLVTEIASILLGRSMTSPWREEAEIITSLLFGGRRCLCRWSVAVDLSPLTYLTLSTAAAIINSLTHNRCRH